MNTIFRFIDRNFDIFVGVILVIFFLSAVIAITFKKYSMREAKIAEIAEDYEGRQKAIRLIHLDEMSFLDYESLSELEKHAFIAKGGKIK